MRIDKPFRTLDLFAGIGGFSLGLERTGGFKTVGFCEIDKKAQFVLKKHWPGVPLWRDIKTLRGDHLHDIDVLTGGFPCQDISKSGKGAGLDGERSGLWFEYARLIEEIKPKYAIIENTTPLRRRGLDRVLRSLNKIGYDAEWHCIPAANIGAPHQRDRIWIVAYPGVHRRSIGLSEKGHWQAGDTTITYHLSNRLNGWTQCGDWPSEPCVGRVVDGFPGRMDRLKQLGNAIVPQIATIIGFAIMDREERL